MMSNLQCISKVSAVLVQLWEVIDSLKTLSTGGKTTDYISQCIMQHILNHMVALNSIGSDNNAILNSRIHPIKWVDQM